MARIRNFSQKATKTRKRVQKYRKLKKLKENLENIDFVSNVDQYVDDSNGQNFEYFNNDTKSEQFCIKKKIRLWVTEHRITKAAVNELLAILTLAGFSHLPKDSRTLLQTPKIVDIKPLSSGKMWYYGLETCLRGVLSNVKSDHLIHLDFNFDGMQLFNSSKLTFWPMLTSIQGICLYSTRKLE